jgi:hypothetical protein
MAAALQTDRAADFKERVRAAEAVALERIRLRKGVKVCT